MLQRLMNVIIIILMILTIVPLCVIFTPIEVLYYICNYIVTGKIPNINEGPYIIKVYSIIYDKLIK